MRAWVAVTHAMLLAVVASGLSAVAGAQAAPVAPPRPARVPFGVGEHLEYDLRAREVVEFHVGSGSMDVSPMDTVRGRLTWHTIFLVSGGLPGYRVNDRYESWMDASTLASLRYFQEIHEGSYEPTRNFEIFPERREYVENEGSPQPSVAHPLDEGSFLYFLRTIALGAKTDTSFDDYFRADRNPVQIHVVRKERISIPAGNCEAIVIEPVIHTTGLFSQNGHAQVWLSDDENRIMLQMKSKLPIWGGQLNLYLKSYRLAGDSTRRTPACR